MKQSFGYLFLVLAFGFAGSSVIAAKYVIDSLPTFTFIAAGLFFAVLLLLPLTAARLKTTLKHMQRIDWLRVLLQAVFGIVLFRLFLNLGLSSTSAAEAGIITGATPATTTLLAKVYLKERLTKKRIAGIVCTVLGILLVQGLLTNITAFKLAHIIGNLLILCAAFSESLFNVFSRLSFVKPSSNQTNPLMQTALVVTIAFLISLTIALFERPLPAFFALPLSAWFAIMYYGFFVTAIAFICWYNGIKRCDAGIAAILSAMMPLTSLTLSVLLLKETMSLQQYIGGALIIFGLVIIPMKRKARTESLQTTLPNHTSSRPPESFH